MTINPTTNKPFTIEDADRLLGLADQFLEDWAVDVVNDGKPDSDYEERNAEWKAIRPLFEQAPAMLSALETAFDRGHFDDDPDDSEMERDDKADTCKLIAAIKRTPPTREQRLSSALQSCVDQMEQCRKGFADDPEFIAVLDEANAVLGWAA